MTEKEKSLVVSSSLLCAAIFSPMFGFGLESWLVGIGSFGLIYFIFSLIGSSWYMNSRILQYQERIMKDLGIVKK